MISCDAMQRNRRCVACDTWWQGNPICVDRYGCFEVVTALACVASGCLVMTAWCQCRLSMMIPTGLFYQWPKTDMASAPRLMITGGLDGGQGVANIETSKRNGKVMASFAVVDDDQLMLVTNQGQVIRIVFMAVRGIPSNCQPKTRALIWRCRWWQWKSCIRGSCSETDDGTASGEGGSSDEAGDTSPTASHTANEDAKKETSDRADSNEDTLTHPSAFTPAHLTLTFGHIDIIERAARLGNQLLLLLLKIVVNSHFSVDERTEIVKTEVQK